MQTWKDERDLVRRTLNGDARAFNSLYKRYHARILATLIGRTRNRHDAEDLMQVTFLRAYRGLAGFRGEAAFSTWLTQIALNVCTTHMRSKQARRSWHQTIEDPQLGYRDIWEQPIQSVPTMHCLEKNAAKCSKKASKNCLSDIAMPCDCAMCRIDLMQKSPENSACQWAL